MKKANLFVVLFVLLSVLLACQVSFAAATPHMIAPIGGETWEVGTIHAIKWDPELSKSPPASVSIWLSTDGGHIFAAFTIEANDGSFDWLIPNTPTTQARIGIQGLGVPTYYTSSESNFTISPARSISVITPAAGDTWEVGTENAITWSSTGLISSVEISYSTNNGSTWTTIDASALNDGLYRWTAPSIVTDEAMIRVSDSLDSKVYSYSSTFEIKARGPITLLTPNGGENWLVGGDYAIAWASSGGVANVNLLYSIDNGNIFSAIDGPISNTGAYTWLVPNTPTTEAIIKVVDAADPLKYDTSNSKFTISTPATSEAVSLLSVSPTDYSWDTSNPRVILIGSGFQAGATLHSSSALVTVSGFNRFSLTHASATLDVSAGAGNQLFILTLQNPDGGTASSAIRVSDERAESIQLIPQYNNHWNKKAPLIIKFDKIPKTGAAKVLIGSGFNMDVDLTKGYIQIDNNQFMQGNGVYPVFLVSNGKILGKVKISIWQ